MSAVRSRTESRVFGFEPWQAMPVALAIASAVRLTRDGVHSVWDVSAAVFVVGFLALLVGQVRDRVTAAEPRPAGRQDWLLTFAIASSTVMFIIPDDRGTPWAWAVAAAALVSYVLLAGREWRRWRHGSV